MPPSGSTFTDWQQELDGERPLLVDEDFSWSDIPTRPRRVVSQAAAPVQPARSRRPARTESPVAQPEPVRAEAADAWDRYEPVQVRDTDAEFEEARRQWSAAYGDPGAEAFDRDDAASYANARVLEDRSGALDLRHSGRRTVVITGRGDSRYTLAPARRRSSELRFHERAGFNPDRTAMWAVLLGIALLIGAVAH